MIISYDRFDALGIFQGTVEIEFDTVLHSTHSTSAQVTEHPVEKGAPANDHVKVGQDRATFEASVSNTPLSPPRTQNRGATGSVRTQSVTVTVARWQFPGVVVKSQETVDIQALMFDGEFDRITDVHEALRQIQANSQLVNVQTTDRVGGLIDYQDMAIQNLSAARSAEDGSSQTFTFDVVKLRIVETKKVAAPDPTKTTKQRGNKGKKEVKAEEQPKLKSILDKQLGGVVDALFKSLGG
jgi:hypothetical protein